MAANPYITDYARRKMAQYSLGEAEVLDTYNNGTRVDMSAGAEAMVRSYESVGYTVGVMYKLDKRTMRYLITSVWKN